MAMSTRLPKATAAAAPTKPPSVEEEEEQEGHNQGGGDTAKQAVVTTTVSQGYGWPNDVTAMMSSSGGATECRETEMDRRRRQVLAMLNTAEGQRMVLQMFVVRDELKQELASLAQRLKRIDLHIETMLQSAAT